MAAADNRIPRIIIIGGVAAGASAATRARRENEKAEIIVLERGPYVSFANCGLPHYLAGEIEHRSALLIQSPETLFERYNLDVRPGHEVLAIDRASQKVRVRLNRFAIEAITEAARRDAQSPDLAEGTEFDLKWDRLILAMGSKPHIPAIKGIDGTHCFTLWNMEDMDRIDAFCKTKKPRTALIIGGGFIGIQMAEALSRRDMKVSLAEQTASLLPQLDPEFSQAVRENLEESGIRVHVNCRVLEINHQYHSATIQAHFAPDSEITPEAPQALPADLVIVAAGSRPNIELATACGLETGSNGGLGCNRHLQTSRDEKIYVCGDLAEIPLRLTKQASQLPLAGPAIRQGRIAGANAARSLQPGSTLAPEIYQGTNGTCAGHFFGRTIAFTGLSEKAALDAGFQAAAVVVHRSSHAAYLPGASLLSLKLVYDREGGRVLGATAYGTAGAEKRIDVLATALAGGLGVHDLAELDLSYAPSLNTANDPVNYAGMVAVNSLQGLAPAVSPVAFLRAFDQRHDLVLDVRMPSEYANGHIPGSVNIPLDELRHRLSEIPRDRPKIWVQCALGFRAHLAIRLLAQEGFTNLVNISGGWLSLQHFFPVNGLHIHR